MESKFRRIIESMRVHQIHNRFIFSISSTELALSEIYTLIELDINPDIQIKQLCKTLHLNRNSVSRAIRKLEDSEHITSEPHRQDKRSRRFRISNKGYKALEIHNQNMRQVIQRYLPNLSFTEVTELSEFYHRISQTLGEPKTTIRTAEHPFVEPIRRVTRAFGFVGSSLFGSGHTSLVWQLLSAIHYGADAPVTLSKLAAGLQIHPATLSQKLDRLEQEGLIVRYALESDGRKKQLQLSKQGSSCLKHIEQCGVKLLARSFSAKEEPELDKFVMLVEKFLEISIGAEHYTLREAVHLESIKEQEKATARGFIVFERARLGLFKNVPQTFIADNTCCYVLKQGAELLALCELQLAEGIAEALHFVFSASVQQQNLLQEFVEELSRILRQDFDVTTLKLPPLITKEISSWAARSQINIETL